MGIFTENAVVILLGKFTREVEMDEHSMCRLLSSVFQPFVNIGPALLLEVKNFLIQTQSVYKGRHLDDLHVLVRTVDLLARLANDVKVKILCT